MLGLWDLEAGRAEGFRGTEGGEAKHVAAFPCSMVIIITSGDISHKEGWVVPYGQERLILNLRKSTWRDRGISQAG